VYVVDKHDKLSPLSGVPKPDCGAPRPIVFADEGRLLLAYSEIDEPPYAPMTAPLAVVRFMRPYMHIFGPPNEEAISGHPLSGRGLHACGAFRVEESSLIRRLERMNSVHKQHDPKLFQSLSHYIFTFHDSTFECVADSFDCSVEDVGLDEEYGRALQLFRAAKPATKRWLR
jgi:hypothetical protein